MIEKNLTEFKTHDEYIDFTGSTKFIKPNVSYCDDRDEVHYAQLYVATGITISETTIAMESGDVHQLMATVSPPEADQRVIWESSDEGIVTVDANGLVTCVNGGNATITVTTKDGNYSAQCAVTAVVRVTGVTLDHTAHTVNVGEEFQLTATVLPSNATNKNITWSSSDDTIATVDSDGLVIGVSNGNVTISATTEDGGFVATCDITSEYHVTAITLSDETRRVTIGEAYTLSATVLPNEAVDKTVTWTSSDDSICTVDQNGVVSGIASGNCVITVTSNDNTAVTATCSIECYHDYARDYFTIVAKAPSVIDVKRSAVSASTNNGSWTSVGTGRTLSLNAGDSVRFKGTSSLSPIFSGSTGDFSVEGNLMSLIYGDNFYSPSYQPSGKTSAFTNTFKGCTGITDAYNLVLLSPSLSAVSLYFCYSMFSGCTNLVDAPKEIPPMYNRGGRQSGACSYMFADCTSLTGTPIFNESIVPTPSVSPRQNYKYMFANCTSLKKAPYLPDKGIDPYQYSGMFSGCTALEDAAEMALSADCRTSDGCCTEMYAGCTSLTGIPESVFSGYQVLYPKASFQGMFSRCTSLTTLPEGLFPNVKANRSTFTQMFADCTSLRTVECTMPTGFSGDNNSTYAGMFSGCTALESVPSNLISSTNAIPANAYDSMFKGCTSLVKAPTLPAATVYAQGYKEMFSGCSSLNEVTCLATSRTGQDECTANWLTGVAPYGTFYKSSSVGWSHVDGNGIPPTWTIIDVN